MGLIDSLPSENSIDRINRDSLSCVDRQQIGSDPEISNLQGGVLFEAPRIGHR